MASMLIYMKITDFLRHALLFAFASMKYIVCIKVRHKYINGEYFQKSDVIMPQQNCYNRAFKIIEVFCGD